MTKDDTETTSRARPMFRWLRKRDRRVIPIEEAAAPSATKPVEVEVAEQQRAAAEERARELELVVERLGRRLRDLQSTARIMQQRATNFDRESRTGRNAGAETASARGTVDAVTEKLFAEVGLRSDCTDFALDAVRRAYLRHYHPDAHATPAEKARATTEFQFYARIFAAIAEKRGRRSTA